MKAFSYESPIEGYFRSNSRNAPESEKPQLSVDAAEALNAFLDNWAGLDEPERSEAVQHAKKFSQTSNPSEATTVVRLIAPKLTKESLGKLDPAHSKQLKRGLVALIDFAKIARSEPLGKALLELRSAFSA